MLSMYEPFQPFLLLHLAKALRARTFIDIGANVGVYSICLGKLESLERIDAFEPDPEAFQKLNRRIEVDGLSSLVKTHQLAVSDKNQIVSFGIVRGASPLNGIIETQRNAVSVYKKIEQVEAICLDSFLVTDSKPICVKIDTEGHELEVLRGSCHAFAARSVVLQVERFNNVGIDALLNEMSFQRICQIGPDAFYTNEPELFTATVVANCFERAADEMVKESMSAFRRKGQTITLEIGGIAARRARAFGSTMRRWF